MNGLFCKAKALIGGCWCILQSACWVVGGRGVMGGPNWGALVVYFAKLMLRRWWCCGAAPVLAVQGSHRVVKCSCLA